MWVLFATTLLLSFGWLVPLWLSFSALLDAPRQRPLDDALMSYALVCARVTVGWYLVVSSCWLAVAARVFTKRVARWLRRSPMPPRLRASGV